MSSEERLKEIQAYKREILEFEGKIHRLLSVLNTFPYAAFFLLNAIHSCINSNGVVSHPSFLKKLSKTFIERFSNSVLLEGQEFEEIIEFIRLCASGDFVDVGKIRYVKNVETVIVLSNLLTILESKLSVSQTSSKLFSHLNKMFSFHKFSHVQRFCELIIRNFNGIEIRKVFPCKSDEFILKMRETLMSVVTRKAGEKPVDLWSMFS